MPSEDPGDLRGNSRSAAAQTSPASPPAESLVALTSDLALVGALESVAGEHRIEILGSEAELASHLMAAQASAAIIDCAATGDAQDLAARLKAQFPDLVLVAAGEAADQAALVAQITDGTVYRFLHKPVSAQRVRHFVEAAFKRHQAAPAPELPAVGPEASPRRSIGIVAAGAALVVLAAGGLWWMSRERSGPAVTAAPAATIAARAAAQAPAPDPVLDALVAQVETALVAEDYAAAEPLLAQARERAPDDPRVAFLATQIDRQLGRELERQRMARVAQLLALASQRIDSGALLEPAGDNASEYVDTARALAPADNSVRAAQRSLAAALLRRARTALAANDAPAVEIWLLAAEAKGANAADLDTVRADARRAAAAQAAAAAVAAQAEARAAAAQAEARRMAAEAATAAASPTPAAPARPSGGSAATQAAAPAAAQAEASESVVSASTLRQVRMVEPRYPESARVAGQTGWVDLEFTVRPNGSVGDIRVMASQPIGVFDEAARDAAGRWRFGPVERDGVPIEQRARIRVRFTLQ